MNGRLGHLGDTWTVRYGSRRGIQVRRTDGSLTRTAYRGWESSSYAPSARTSLYSPVPAAQPYGLNLGASALGDKYDDATREAWDASHWVWGRAVKTKADALVAARWIYLQAAREARSAYFNDLAAKCAYAYDSLSMQHVLKVAWNEARTAGAQRAAGKAQALRAQVDRDERSAPRVARAPAGRGTPNPPQVPTPTVDDGGEGVDWRVLLSKWGPWVVGGAAVVVLGKMLFFPRGNVRVVGP